MRIAKCGLIAVCFCFAALPAPAQRRPDVHADFQFGAYPWSREAADLMAGEQARLMVVGFSRGWDLERISRQFSLSMTDLSRMIDQLENLRLVRGTDYDFRPGMLVVRERDFERLQGSLRQHVEEFGALIESHWSRIEGSILALEGSRTVPKEQLMYEVVVSGLLLGGMIDAFYEDKTLLPGPPRRDRNNGFYAWIVEGDPAGAGKLRREIRESSGYRIVTIGTALPDERLQVEQLQGRATVYEDADARAYRVLMSVFARDTLLPFFKSRRDQFFMLGAQVESGRQVAFAEFFAWYYMMMAEGVADRLEGDGRIAAPDGLYTYALRAPR